MQYTCAKKKQSWSLQDLNLSFCDVFDSVSMSSSDISYRNGRKTKQTNTKTKCLTDPTFQGPVYYANTPCFALWYNKPLASLNFQ